MIRLDVQSRPDAQRLNVEDYFSKGEPTDPLSTIECPLFGSFDQTFFVSVCLVLFLSHVPVTFPVSSAGSWKTGRWVEGLWGMVTDRTHSPTVNHTKKVKPLKETQKV